MGIQCRIVSLDELGSDAGRYEGFLTCSPGNLIYGTPAFLRFISQVTGARVDIILAEENGDIVGALPFAVAGAAQYGYVLNSLPWWGSHGSIFLDRKRSDGEAIRISLLRVFVDEIRRIEPLSAMVVMLPDEQDSKNTYLTIMKPNVIDERIGQITELPESNVDIESTLLGKFRQNTRNLVRKSGRQNFDERVTDDEEAWDYLVTTHERGMAAIGGLAKPRSHIDALRQTIPVEQRRLSLAVYDEKPVAAMLILMFNGTIEYFVPTVSTEYRSRQPLSFLIVQGMLEAIRKGYRLWNWGGTRLDQTTLHHFKAGFGAVDRPYSYLIKARPDARAVFRENRVSLAERFPFFYTYPYDRLDDSS